MNAELKITGRLAEVGNLDGGSTPGASIYAGDGRYIEVHNLSEDEARAIAPAFGEMVTVSIALTERTTSPVSQMTDSQVFSAVEEKIGHGHGAWDMVNPKDLAQAFREVLAAAAPQAQTDYREIQCTKCGQYGLHICNDAQATQQPKNKPNADCSGDPTSCPDNEGYGCACDPMNKAAGPQS